MGPNRRLLRSGFAILVAYTVMEIQATATPGPLGTNPPDFAKLETLSTYDLLCRHGAKTSYQSQSPQSKVFPGPGHSRKCPSPPQNPTESIRGGRCRLW
ncbi:hypothetical protein EDB83DRAFT_272066 [Lactarius deliciosus]|nr:hypothetical protein EDB83DRAFT_272066 [Lactarius deliciosus]